MSKGTGPFGGHMRGQQVGDSWFEKKWRIWKIQNPQDTWLSYTAGKRGKLKKKKGLSNMSSLSL